MHAVPDTSRKVLEDLDCEARAMKVADWPSRVEPDSLTHAYWQDPDSAFAGVLSADLIRHYHYEVGRMIRPFREENLHPASYDLTLGPRCLIEGDPRELTDDDPVLTIPPNSIVFVTSWETLAIPHWLIGRFNLATKWLFHGLLMGAGPQFDPGFQGVLSCPLHNISSNPIRLRLRDPFARIDFEKTTWPKAVPAKDEDELYEKAAKGQLTGSGGEALLLWDRQKRSRSPIYFVPESREVTSSVRRIEQDLDATKGQFRLGTVINIVLLATVVAAAAALMTVAFMYTDGRVDDVKEAQEKTESRTTKATGASRTRDREMRMELKRLRRELRELRAQR